MENKNFNLLQTNVILENEDIRPYNEILSRPIVADIIRETLENIRRDIKNTSKIPDKEEIISLCKKKIRYKANLPIKRVINATGTIMHTNLGRSPIDSDIWDEVRDINTNSNNLEYDINKEERGKRGAFLYTLLAKLTGAEDALVVNNNAASVFLILRALAKGREVIVSRGEQVQIGGGFRIPDILREAECTLVEIGTTNIVTIKDYIDSVTENTAMILKVHASNFKIRGFTKHPSFKKIRDAISRDIPIVYDEGAGILNEEMTEEEHIKSALKNGVDLVCFSADKMFSSVQAGIIVGKKEYINKIYKHPLMRAFRCGKTVLSILEKYSIKRLNLNEKAVGYCEKLLSIDPKIIESKAMMIAEGISGIDIVEESVETGGGAMADVFFPSYALKIKPNSIRDTLRDLHNLDIAIIGKVKKDSILIYPITIDDSDIAYVKTSLKSILK